MMSRLPIERQREIDLELSNILLSIDKTYPEDSLQSIIEAYGDVRVTEYDFDDGGDKICGAISYKDGKPRIFVNQKLMPERKTFTLAHEFGHLVLHNNEDKFRLDFFRYDGSDEARQESEANYFAATLLMPKDRFISVSNLLSGDDDLIARYFGVSRAAVRNRRAWLLCN